MKDQQFIEEIFELAFGDNAIKKGYTREEVLTRIREFSDQALLYKEKEEETLPSLKEDLAKIKSWLQELADHCWQPGMTEVPGYDTVTDRLTNLIIATDKAMRTIQELRPE